jgi:hypothetical protein
MLIIGGHSALERCHQLTGTGPFLQPETLFFERAHDPCGVRIRLRVVIAGTKLAESPGFRRPAGTLLRWADTRGRASGTGPVPGHPRGTDDSPPSPGQQAKAALCTVCRHHRPRSFWYTKQGPRQCRPSQYPRRRPWSSRCPTTRWAWWVLVYGRSGGVWPSTSRSAGPRGDAPAASARPVSCLPAAAPRPAGTPKSGRYPQNGGSGLSARTRSRRPWWR